MGIALEGKLRAEASKLTGDNHATETAPFSKDNRVEIKPAQFVYVSHLWDQILWMLEEMEKRGLCTHKT